MATATEAGAVQGEVLRIPLGKLKEAAYNPRQHFNEKELADLVESVKSKGVINPILARPVNGHFEIIAGARRFRASKAAGLKDAPVLVRALNDQEALEVAVIDNLQRVDVHPLDEAGGYKALLGQPGYDVAAIAAKVGKSESFIYQRLKLAELITPVKKAFWDEEITFAHAIQIARLQEKDQEAALEECFSEARFSGKRLKRQEILSTRELATWIHDNITLNLSGAPWKKDDAQLVPKAGACNVCPKRTGNCPQLFPEISNKDVCTDRECFNQKAEAFVAKRIAEQEEKGKTIVRITDQWQTRKEGVLGDNGYRVVAGQKACSDTKLGIFIDGPKRATVTTICTKPDECKVHRPRSTYQSNGLPKRSAAEEKKRQDELHKERIRVRSRTMIFKATIEGISKLDRTLLNQLAADLSDNAHGEEFYELYGEFGDKVPNRKGIEALGETGLARLIAASMICHHEDEQIIAEAKRHGVKVADLQRIAKHFCDFERDHKERVKKWKNRVASQAKSYEEPTCTGCGCTETTACKVPFPMPNDVDAVRGCSWSEINKKSNAGTCSACAETDEK